MKMKQNIFNIFAAGCLLLGLSSCHEDIVGPTLSGDGEGMLKLSTLNIDTSHSEKVVNSSGSRAATPVSEYKVKITDRNTGVVAGNWVYGQMPEVLTLPVSDNYLIEVESHEIQKAEWDHPYYTGNKEFSIQNGEITDIGTVTAYFSSLKVSIVFDESLKPVLGDDVTVTVKANDEGELVYTKDETRSGYFATIEGSNTMIVEFKGTVDGAPTSYISTFTDVESGQHRIITYKIKNGPVIPDQTGTINPGGIGIDADVEIIDKDGNITIEEDIIESGDRPGHEVWPDNPDPGPGPDVPPVPDDKTAATFEATNSPHLSLDAVNTVTDDFGNAIVTIKCPKGIKNLLVTINTDSDNFYSALDDLGLAQPFDLAYPGDLEDKIGEGGLGLATGSKVINQTEVPFDITLFVPMLAGFPGNHTFTLAVTDNDGNTSSLTLKFIANQQ